MPEIEKLIAAFEDPGVIELMINDDGSVYVERSRGLERIDAKAGGPDVSAFVKALVGDSAVTPQRPYADLSAADGSRVHVIAPPLTKSGVAVTVRKRPARRPNLDELVQAGTLTPGCAGFLKFAVQQRRNILVVGGTSSGKTTLLAAMAAAAFDQKERVLILEDTPEITLPQPHVMSLKTRLRDAAGGADVTLADLVANTLRMRPDRIIVGEVRGKEAADMMQAMNVGQEGTLCTLHANSCREALQRLETLVLMAGHEVPIKAVRSNIQTAVDLIVFVARLADGTRRVMQIAEITGMETDNITMADLFKCETRKGPQGLSVTLRPTGAIPRFYDQLRSQGHEPPLDFFKSN
jgi:pilus assembly protein CpaF